MPVAMLICIDRSIEIVRRAVAMIGKKPLARMARVNHGVLRNVDGADFSPHARKLRNLELAARDVLGLKVPEDVQ